MLNDIERILILNCMSVKILYADPTFQKELILKFRQNGAYRSDEQQPENTNQSHP